ncbi:unnamed protein product [Urochloa humidicola]
MMFPRELTPHPRRRPSIPVPASRLAVHAVPFSPRTSPPPSATPTPLNLPPFTTAFDPLHMLPSSSSGPAVGRQVHPTAMMQEQAAEEGPLFLGDLFRELEDKGKSILGARPPSTPTIPKARDIRMVGRASPTGSRSPDVGATAAPASSARSPCSPPSPASPVAQAAPGAAAGEGDGGDNTQDEAPATASASDEEEEISVESDDLDDGPEYVEVWVEEGDWERAARFAFVELEPVTATANPAPTIRGALLRAAPRLRYQMLPSAHGVALLHFNSAADREEAMQLQPIHHHGTLVKLGRIEETDDCFYREPAWLALVTCWNFPEEHWDVPRIHALYEGGRA